MATFSAPVTVNGNFYIGYETQAQNVYLCNLNSGTGGVAFYRDTVNGPVNWTQSNLVDTPSWRVQCQSTSSGFLTPAIGINGLPRLGTTYNLTLADAVPTSFALMSSGLSDQAYQGLPLPLALPGAPGCALLNSAEAVELQLTDGSGNSSHPIAVPSQSSLVGFQLFHQWLVWDPTVNNLSIVTSAGGRATVGN
jgi:hypothetical protein